MMKVTPEQFKSAGERQPHGFTFHYSPGDADYGIGITTSGTIPQLHSMEEAVRVGKVLQASIFGREAIANSRTYVD